MAFTKTWISTSFCYMTGLDVSGGFKFFFASLLLVFKIRLSPSEFWSLKRKAFFLTDTSKYFYTWFCFPVILYLIFSKSVLEYSCSCFYFSVDCFPVNKIFVVIGYHEEPCAVINVVSLKDSKGFIFEDGNTLPWFQIKQGETWESQVVRTTS